MIDHRRLGNLIQQFAVLMLQLSVEQRLFAEHPRADSQRGRKKCDKADPDHAMSLKQSSCSAARRATRPGNFTPLAYTQRGSSSHAPATSPWFNFTSKVDRSKLPTPTL